MSYTRVIPRDLFNEADLLKCLGALYIALDEKARGHRASWGDADEDGLSSFDIDQGPDGELVISNLPLFVGSKPYGLTRPLNSRASWPLYLYSFDDDNFDTIAIFNDDGTLTGEFLVFIGAPVRPA